MSTDATVKQKHPRGLFYLFGVEAWERFSYYGMRAILVLYMVNHLEFERSQALSVYATYTGLVYLTPLLGGMLADRYLGARKAIFAGGFLMTLGEVAMIFPDTLYLGLGLLIVGNGFFKPNISSILGGLYEDKDPRKDAAFTIFYMGINFGAFFSPLVCGTLGEKFGFQYGFAAAAVGMFVGTMIFLFAQGRLGTAGFPPARKDIDSDSRLNRRDWVDIAGLVSGLFGVVLVVVLGLEKIVYIWSMIPGSVKIGAGVLLLAGAMGGLLGIAGKGGKDDLKSVGAILILTVFVFFFWMGFEQAGGTLTLFADKQTDRHLFGFEIPASYFQSLNPLFIVSFAPIFSILWVKLDSSRFKTSIVIKMAIGMIVLGLGFVLMILGQTQYESSQALVSPLFLVGVYFLHTMGELCLSPIGLSMVSKMSPKRMVSLMMGVWFLSSAGANYVAGTLESILSQYDVPLFSFLMVTSFGAGILLLLISPLLKRWMGGN